MMDFCFTEKIEASAAGFVKVKYSQLNKVPSFQPELQLCKAPLNAALRELVK